jgi:hypothetical protein
VNPDFFTFDESPAGARFGGNADWQCAWGWCEPFNTVIYEAEWVNNPTGVLYLQGSNDSNQIGTTPAAATVLTIPVLAGFYGAWPNAAGVPGAGVIVISQPWRWHRIGYTFGAGGTVNDFKVVRTVRK